MNVKEYFYHKFILLRWNAKIMKGFACFFVGRNLYLKTKEVTFHSIMKLKKCY